MPEREIMLTRLLVLVFVATGASALQLPAAAAVGGLRRCASARMDGTQDRIKDMVESNKILLFMKGNKMFPQCGFSNTAVMILNSIPAASGYETFDVLSDQAVRDGVKTYSAWPTIPQCYIDGEFIGGCDIIIEMYQSGELQEMVEKSAAS